MKWLIAMLCIFSSCDSSPVVYYSACSTSSDCLHKCAEIEYCSNRCSEVWCQFSCDDGWCAISQLDKCEN